MVLTNAIYFAKIDIMFYNGGEGALLAFAPDKQSINKLLYFAKALKERIW